MGDLDDYADVREGSPDYFRGPCPQCGVVRWFDRRGDKPPHCWECGRWQYQDVIMTHECGLMMQLDGDAWVCHYCGDARDTDRQRLIGVMTSTHEAAGYERPCLLDCPRCDESSLDCLPDGERVCEGCGLYLDRFGDGWFALAEWRLDRGHPDVQFDPGPVVVFDA